jgi:type III secretion system low calcium response chaperone LcrH/SycD
MAEKPINVSDQQTEAIYLLAFELYQKGEYAKATTLFSGLVLARKNEFKFWLGLGASHQMLKNYNKALNAYNIAQKIKPKNPMPFFHTAECLWSQKDSKNAIAFLGKAEKRAQHNHAKYASFLNQVGLLKENWSKKRKIPVRSY